MERQRLALLADVAGLDPGQLDFRPAPESWSTLEVVEHLVRVEEAIVLRASQAVSSQSLGSRIRSAAGMLLLYQGLRMGARFKAPSQAILPEGKSTLPELRGRWDRIREKLEAVLADRTRADLSRPMMRHPAVGWLNPVQTLTFLERHVAHHVRQIERIRAVRVTPRANEVR